jgi:subtilisin family serine protease
MADPYSGFIVVRLTPEAALHDDWQKDDLRSAVTESVEGLSQVLDAFNVTTRRGIDAVTPEGVARLEAGAAPDSNHPPRSLNHYWIVDARTLANPESLIEKLKATHGVELVYRHTSGGEPTSLASVLANPFAAKQQYVARAPMGIGAASAWVVECGDGCRTGFVDIEQGWFVNLGVPGSVQHEDLPNAALFPGVPRETSQNACPPSSHHGTAVLGIVCGLDNGKGIVGLAPHVRSIDVASHRQNGVAGFVANAIAAVLPSMDAGDVLLIEYQDGFNRPAETDPMTFQAIQLACSRGIVVVEPAGNMNIDLDTVPGLSRADPDSGAIIVGACKSQLAASGTGHDRWVMTPADFVLPGPVPPFLADCGYGMVPPMLPGSNYGSRVDCYAWGEHVTSAGYGWLAGTSVVDSYTDRFSGTSAAAAIVAGAAVTAQSIVTCLTGIPLRSPQMRELLSTTGTPSGNRAERIGTMPDLEKVVAVLRPTPASPTGLRIVT